MGFIGSILVLGFTGAVIYFLSVKAFIIDLCVMGMMFSYLGFWPAFVASLLVLAFQCYLRERSGLGFGNHANKKDVAPFAQAGQKNTLQSRGNPHAGKSRASV